MVIWHRILDKQCTYRFQIHAVTQPGETIALVGSLPRMGLWDVEHAIRLQTQGDRYPLWWVDLELDELELDQDAFGKFGGRRIEYKYVRLHDNGSVTWEAWGSNRWVPLEATPLPSPIIVEDGWFGQIPAYPYGYYAKPIAEPPVPPSQGGLKVAVMGSSVALGCSAWLLRGWAWQLGQALQYHYGHQLINLSEIGANVSTTIDRFSRVVASAQPDIVVIALSLGNEGLASSSPQHYRAIQRRFENGLQQLIKMTRELGASPILADVYPNGDYSSVHYRLLRETHNRMLTWDVPVLDWFADLDDGQGQWQEGIAWDAAHPNTKGHQLMYEAIDLSYFEVKKLDPVTQSCPHPLAKLPIYQDGWGFHVFASKAENNLRLINTTPHSYTVCSDWQALQAAFQKAAIPAGLYIAEATATNSISAQITDGMSDEITHEPSDRPVSLLSLVVQDHSRIEVSLTIPPQVDLTFYSVFHFFAAQQSQMLFHDGHLSILKISDRQLYIINESDHEYNIQPMWEEVRTALKVMPVGVYEDPCHRDAPFRTLMIGEDGLESRVKAPAQSALGLAYKCSLSEVSRVAIIPLGDRCAVRMLLYKLEYDGPAFPFDLTRTTKLSDVADMVQTGFHDMWNPNFLEYNHDARRIYHRKWTGLSFAHEVEDSDDPVNDMSPVYERMRIRYTARSKRFGYTLQKSDEALFVRTGLCDRGSVIDLVQKLENKYQGKPFRLLLLSPQASEEFAHLPNVVHYNLEFNPDRMYEDLEYWGECTATMGKILNSLGISSKNLFWCPPNRL